MSEDAKPRLFPVLEALAWRKLRELGCPKSVPWGFIAPHEFQAGVNHYQDLETLARRGGLDPVEMVAVLRSERWNDRKFQNLEDAVPELKRLLAEWEANQGPKR